MGRGQGQIICYKCTQLGHFTSNYQNPCTTCSYCNSFEHVIEYCLVLLAKLQERRGGNQQVQLILVEPCKEDPRVTFITRGGTIIGEDRVTLGKTAKGSGIIRDAEKAQLFIPRRDRHAFEEAINEFERD